jgi:hypothetical protein
MVAFRLEDFAGQIPRRASRLLPNTFAEDARNTNLFSGTLRGINKPTLRQALDSSPGAVFRIPNSPEDIWMTFTSENVDVEPGPVINDAFDRFYWTGDGAPKYNTRSRLAAEDPPFLLGVPAPTAAPTIGATGGVGAAETRSYVYTFVSAYNEEGPPSPPSTITGKEDDTWSLSALEIDTDIPDYAERNITHKRIYRTVTGTEGTRFHFVDEIDIEDTTFADVVSNATAGANDLLESTEWEPPPAGLDGLVAMPNGFFVGFVGQNLYFSEPYRPHAWPARYTLSTAFPIVGLGVHGSVLAVCTQSHPYIAYGVNPEAISFVKVDAIEPCVSKRSIVAMDMGVVYASANGLILINENGARNVTHDLIERDDWQTLYSPTTLRAVRYRSDYIGFVDGANGFLVNFDEPRQAITDIEDTRPFNNVGYCKYTGNIQLLIGDQVWRWDPVGTLPYTYVWKSKLFRTPKPVNLGALHVEFSTEPVDVEQLLLQAQEYNAARWPDKPLDAIGWTGIARRRPVPGLTGLALPQRSPLGGPMLYPEEQIAESATGATIIVYAENRERWRKAVERTGYHRLPSGYKSDTWQIEIIGNAEIVSVVVAETMKELERL